MYLPDVPNMYVGGGGTKPVSRLYLGDELVWPVCGIKMVYGIKGTVRTTNYIKLNFNTSSTLRVDVKFRVLQQNGGLILGGNTGQDNNDYRMFYTGGRYYNDVGNGRAYASRAMTGETFEIGNLYIKDLKNGDIVVSGATNTAPTSRYHVNIGYLEFYWLKAYEGNTLIFDGVPAKDCDGYYGIYDKLSGEFFTATESPSAIEEITPSSSVTIYTAEQGIGFGRVSPTVQNGQFTHADNLLYLNFRTSKNLKVEVNARGFGQGSYFGGGGWDFSYTGGTSGILTVGNSTLNTGGAPNGDGGATLLAGDPQGYVYNFGAVHQSGTLIASGETVQSVTGDRFYINVGQAEFIYGVRAWDNGILIFDGVFGSDTTSTVQTPVYANPMRAGGGLYDRLTNQFFKAPNADVPVELVQQPVPDEHIIYFSNE